MYELCSCCQSWQTQPVSAVGDAPLENREEHHADCLRKHYGIHPLSERLALPPKPTLFDAYLPYVSMFGEGDAECQERLNRCMKKWVYDNYVSMVTRWEVDWLFWLRLWYCADCDSVFDPDTQHYTPSAEMTKLLPG